MSVCRMLSGRFRSWIRICQIEERSLVVGLWSLANLHCGDAGDRDQKPRTKGRRPATNDRFPTVTIKRWQPDRTVARRKTGGKSELRRAVCRITSGKPGSSPVDGKCHRKHTAPPSLWARPFLIRFLASRKSRAQSDGGVRVKRCGKSAPP